MPSTLSCVRCAHCNVLHVITVIVFSFSSTSFPSFCAVEGEFYYNFVKSVTVACKVMLDGAICTILSASLNDTSFTSLDVLFSALDLRSCIKS